MIYFRARETITFPSTGIYVAGWNVDKTLKVNEELGFEENQMDRISSNVSFFFLTFGYDRIVNRCKSFKILFLKN